MKKDKPKWLNIKNHEPDMDESVLIVNNKIPTLPHKAYYDRDTKSFLSLENNTSFPLHVTHWMSLPEPPIKAKND